MVDACNYGLGSTMLFHMDLKLVQDELIAFTESLCEQGHRLLSPSREITILDTL